MAIKGNVSAGVLNLGITDADVSVLNSGASPSRVAVTAFSLFNTSAIAVTVNVYESPDATSAAGKLVATYVLAATGTAGCSADVVECIGQGYASVTQLVCKIPTLAVAAGDVNAKVTATQYTAGS